MKSKRFLWLALLLVGLPAVLFWPLRKMAHDRLRVAGDWGPYMGMDEFFFSTGGQTVCAMGTSPDPMGKGCVRCWNTGTGEEVEMPPDPKERRCGPLHFRGALSGGVYWRLDGDAKPSRGSDPIYNFGYAAFSPDGVRLTLAARDQVSGWDLQKGQLLWQTRMKPADRKGRYAEICELSLDGALCEIQWGKMDEVRRLAVIDSQNGRIVSRLPAFYCDASGFAPDSRTFWMWRFGGEVRFFDARTAKLLWRTAAPLKPDFTAQGIVGVPGANGFEFFDTRTGKLLRHPDSPRQSQIETWNFTPDGKQLWWYGAAHQILYRRLD